MLIRSHRKACGLVAHKKSMTRNGERWAASIVSLDAGRIDEALISMSRHTIRVLALIEHIRRKAPEYLDLFTAQTRRGL